jgi:predicted TIM-barrel fold metal-dependent hydrolase
MDAADVTASLVVIQADTAEFFRLARTHPGRLFGLAFYDSLYPAEGLEQIQALYAEHPAQLLGVATAFPFFRQDPRAGEFAPLYEFCRERRLPVQFHTRGDQGMEAAGCPVVLGELAAAYPGLQMVCLHAGGPGHRELPALLRAYPNLYAEVDGLQDAELANGKRPAVLRNLLRDTPSRKLMFGSSWSARGGAYDDRVRTIRSLSVAYRADVCWRTAATVYGLHPSPHGRAARSAPLSAPR